MGNTYAIGDIVRCTASFTRNGTAIDPTSVTALIKTPVTVNAYAYGVDAALVKDAIGTYHIDIFPSSAGVYFYRFEGTGSAEAAREAAFMVAASAFY